jgi:hypothetical protein
MDHMDNWLIANASRTSRNRLLLATALCIAAGATLLLQLSALGPAVQGAAPAAMLLAVAAVVLGGPAIHRIGKPYLHPVVRKATQWGNLGDLVRALEQDRRGGTDAGSWRIGRQFATRAGWFSMEVHDLNDVLWVYGVPGRRAGGGRTQLLVMRWADAELRVEVSEDTAVRVLHGISTHQPWVVFGWSTELETLYEHKRGSFSRQVALARRRWDVERIAARDFVPTQPHPLAMAA